LKFLAFAALTTRADAAPATPAHVSLRLVMPRKSPTRPRKAARQDRSQATVDAILEAAARLFAEGGLDAINTNQIAERAGVSIGSLYQYFPGKQAILGELIDRHSEQTITALAAKLEEFADSGTRSIPAVLREIVEILLEADTIDLNLHRVFLDKLPDAGRIEQRHGEIRRMTAAVRERLLEQRRGDLAVGDLDVAAVVLVHALEAVTNAVVFEFPDRLRDPRLVDEITALATRYLLPSRA
jgi:AcrR family transcriptional regulator